MNQASNSGLAWGWQVWMASAQGIQLGSAWCWKAWNLSKSSSGAAHTQAEAAAQAKAALLRMQNTSRARTLRLVESPEDDQR